MVDGEVQCDDGVAAIGIGEGVRVITSLRDIRMLVPSERILCRGGGITSVAVVDDQV